MSHPSFEPTSDTTLLSIALEVIADPPLSSPFYSLCLDAMLRCLFLTFIIGKCCIL